MKSTGDVNQTVFPKSIRPDILAPKEWHTIIDVLILHRTNVANGHAFARIGGQSNPCSVNSREAFPSVQSLKRPW